MTATLVPTESPACRLHRIQLLLAGRESPSSACMEHLADPYVLSSLAALLAVASSQTAAEIEAQVTLLAACGHADAVAAIVNRYFSPYLAHEADPHSSPLSLLHADTRETLFEYLWSLLPIELHLFVLQLGDTALASLSPVGPPVECKSSGDADQTADDAWGDFVRETARRDKQHRLLVRTQGKHRAASNRISKSSYKGLKVGAKRDGEGRKSNYFF
ncbi:hypothetical protein BC831DRAFT_451729 [Entophlyctis helioformis]|nr:hypothetical protein BC831DRAFT_451729 [Entophlyctis helioformis]